MKRKFLLTLVTALFICCLFTVSIHASFDSKLFDSSATYYLEEYDSGIVRVYQMIYNEETEEYEDITANFLYRTDYFDNLNDEYDNYQSALSSGAILDTTTFEEHLIFGQGWEELYLDTKLTNDVNAYAQMKKDEETENAGGGNDDTSSGGNSGSTGGSESDGGSDSSGTGNGTPNVHPERIEPSMGDDIYNCYHDGNSGYVNGEPCECFVLGFNNGWYAAMNSDELKAIIQEAFDQGFREVNTVDYQDKLANEKEAAVESFKNSEEYLNSLEEAKITAVKEYRSSNKFVEDFQSEENTEEENQKIEEIRESIIEAFKSSPEQLEIIGAAEEGAKADLVVEMESVLSGNGIPSEGAASDLNSLVQEKIESSNNEAVGEFVESMQSIMSGESNPPAEGTPESDLNNSITKNINTAFNEGVEQGESNYKNSVEFKLSMQTEYEAGAEAGYQQGFLIGTNDGYADGLIDGAEFANEELYNKGKTEYMNTKEYQNTIQDTYDMGYEDGTESSSNSAAMIVPIVILSALLVVMLMISSNRKKKHK